MGQQTPLDRLGSADALELYRRLVFPVGPVGWVNDQGNIRFDVHRTAGAPPTWEHRGMNVVAINDGEFQIAIKWCV
jgi:hypothetical protein